MKKFWVLLSLLHKCRKSPFFMYGAITRTHQHNINFVPNRNFRFMQQALLFVVICCLPVFAGLKEGKEAYKKADYATALKEYQMLAEKGEAEGQYCLANLYRDGKGVKKDFVTALKWMTDAANQGHIMALYALSSMYKYGKGTEKNPLEAYKLILVALELNKAEKEPEVARSTKEMCDLELEFLAKQLTPDQIKEAASKAKEWKTQKK